MGSSSTSSVAGVSMNLASASRAFSPPLRNFTCRSIPAPLNSIRPSSALTSSSLASGAARLSVSSAESSRSSSSAWFCTK